MLFPTLAVGLFDFKSLCCPRPPCGAWLQCSTATFPCASPAPNPEYPCSAPPTKYPCIVQLLSIPAVPNQCRVSLQCPTTKHPCSAQLLRIPAVLNRRVSRQCPTTKHPCSSAQPQSIPAAPNSRVPLCPNPQCSMAKCRCRAQPLQCQTPQQCQTAIFWPCICSAARKTVWGRGRKPYISCAIMASGWGCSK